MASTGTPTDYESDLFLKSVLQFLQLCLYWFIHLLNTINTWIYTTLSYAIAFNYIRSGSETLLTFRMELFVRILTCSHCFSHWSVPFKCCRVPDASISVIIFGVYFDWAVGKIWFLEQDNWFLFFFLFDKCARKNNIPRNVFPAAKHIYTQWMLCKEFRNVNLKITWINSLWYFFHIIAERFTANILWDCRCFSFQLCTHKMPRLYWSWFFTLQKNLSTNLPSELTLPIPCISESCIEIKSKLNFYFNTSLWCLKRFYEGL